MVTDPGRPPHAQFAAGFRARFGIETAVDSAAAANACLAMRMAIEIAADDTAPSIPSGEEIVEAVGRVAAETFLGFNRYADNATDEPYNLPGRGEPRHNLHSNIDCD